MATRLELAPEATEGAVLARVINIHPSKYFRDGVVAITSLDALLILPMPGFAYPEVLMS